MAINHPAVTGKATERTMAPRRAGAEVAKLLSLYNVYRAVLGIVILTLGLADATRLTKIEGYHAGLIWLAVIWLSSAALLLWQVRFIASKADGGPLGVILFDLVMIAFLVRLGQPLGPGLPLLYLLTVAAGALLISNRITATAVAALASIAILSDSTYQLQQGLIDANGMLSAGLLGSLIFLISLLLQQIVGKMAAIEELADAAATQVATLEELNEQVIAHMTIGVCRVWTDNRITAINQAAAQLLNLPGIGTSIPVDRLHSTLAEHIHLWQSGQHTIARPFKVHPEGKTLLPELVRIGHDFEPETLLFVEDYTPITEAAQTLKLNALGKLTASIAHEIRNPLAAISHASQLLDESIDDPSEHKALRDIIFSNTQRVNEIIENVLQLSRREEPRQEPLDLLAWLHLFVPEYEQGQTHPHCVKLSAPAPVGQIVFDAGNLRRVLTNLLDNGIRHAGEHTGQFTVTLSLTKDELTKRAHMDVVDAGTGVPETLLDRLFEPFFTTSPTGSGLGLYLCRELCDSNGATLAYDRTPEGHSRFRISVPLQGLTK
jgi:two-component system sensor histidine kinase PilS (NtrC family)